ncbi:MAG: efflux RND transporter periplasmic adaptor subunit [Planctomycetota bacterium]|jgi:HlyD family secretion protein
MSATGGKRAVRWIAGGLLLVALVWVAVESRGGGEQVGVAGAPVQRGPLRINVVERGSLSAADSVTLKSELEGQTTVLWLIEEGAEVEPGDIVCELDTSQHVSRRVQQEIKVQNAEASLVKARQNLAIQISQNESDIARAEQELEFAHLDLKKYEEGDMPQELQALEEAILLSGEELSRAAQDLIWSEKLAERGFLEQTQLDADRLSKTRAEVTLNQARRAKELFQDYEIPRRRKELNADVTEMERELERVKLQAEARLADYKADLASAEATSGLERDELAKIVSQIEKGTLRAPVAGMVVFAVESRGRYGSGDPMQEGASVRERQDIITIPSSKGFVAEVSLHETVLEKVDVGMACLVSVDALRETFPGTVSFKALLPDQQSWWANPDLRVYRTEVKLQSQDPRIRPGMSCSIEILVDDLPDVLYVPLQAVFLDAGEPICFVSDAGDVEKREVEVGQSNTKWVEIRSGLAEGEVVLLSRPPGVTLRPAPEHGPEQGPPEGPMGEGVTPGGPPADGREGRGRSGGPGGKDGDGSAGGSSWSGGSESGGGHGQEAGGGSGGDAGRDASGG